MQCLVTAWQKPASAGLGSLSYCKGRRFNASRKHRAASERTIKALEHPGSDKFNGVREACRWHPLRNDPATHGRASMVNDAQTGRVSMATLIELLVIVLIVPPLICCALQALVMMVGIVVPWLVLGVIVLGVVACLAAGVGARRRVPPFLEHDDLQVRVPPLRRPR